MRTVRLGLLASLAKYWRAGASQLNRATGTIFLLLASEASKPSRTVRTIYIFPGQCHTVISNLAITRIILNPFYNAAVYTAYSEPTMHCIHLVYIYI